MGLLRHCRRHSSYPTLPTLAALILLLSSSAISLPQFDSSPGGAARQGTIDDRTKMEMEILGGSGPGTDQSRRNLRGFGSSPPTCQSKCGRCFPCRPVHVPIQPGVSMPLEYYPEAWRCQCGSKLFMP